MRFLLLSCWILVTVGSFICQTEEMEPLLQALENPVVKDCDAQRHGLSIERACVEIPVCRLKYEKIGRTMPDCEYIVDADGRNLGQRLKSEIQACTSSATRASLQLIALVCLKFVMFHL